MRATVNQDCIGCGLCVNTCPAVFTMADTNMAVAVDFPTSEVDLVHEAADACPVDAISLEED